jgi:hypothetical protein
LPETTPHRQNQLERRRGASSVERRRRRCPNENRPSGRNNSGRNKTCPRLSTNTITVTARPIATNRTSPQRTSTHHRHATNAQICAPPRPARRTSITPRRLDLRPLLKSRRSTAQAGRVATPPASAPEPSRCARRCASRAPCPECPALAPERRRSCSDYGLRRRLARRNATCGWPWEIVTRPSPGAGE